jgi:phenol/toluene 2-monooxygenase (NADH) P2/A2
MPSTQPVFIAFQANNDTRPIIEAIIADNPNAKVHEMPALVKIDAPGRLVVRRDTIAEIAGRDFDLREIYVNLISLAGEVDESEEEFVLEWKGS